MSRYRAGNSTGSDTVQVEVLRSWDDGSLHRVGPNFATPPNTIEVGYVVWPQNASAQSYDVYCNANGKPDPYAGYWDQNSWNTNTSHLAFTVGAQPNWLNGPTLAGMMAAPIPALFGPDPGVVEWYYERFGAYTWSVTPHF